MFPLIPPPPLPVEETDGESGEDEGEWEQGANSIIDTSGKGDLFRQSGATEDIAESRKLHLKHIFE